MRNTPGLSILTHAQSSMASWHEHVRAQAYHLGLAALNRIHGLLPFAARPLLYRLVGFAIDRSATVQGGVRFFHVGRLHIGPHSLINRGVYLDNRAGLTIGANVSIAHDSRIYTLGHDVHAPDFRVLGRPVRIDDHVVIFAGAMVMPGVHLGRGVVVMAGSVVTKSVPSMRVVGGNPARDLGPRRAEPGYSLSRRYWLAH